MTYYTVYTVPQECPRDRIVVKISEIQEPIVKIQGFKSLLRQRESEEIVGVAFVVTKTPAEVSAARF